MISSSGNSPAVEKMLKPLTNDHFNFIAINEVRMWVANNGDGSHDPATDGNGFFWPGGKLARKAAIFEDGLLWGGKVNGQIRVNGNTHRQGIQAGKILSPGVSDNPDDPRYRVYKIRKDWESYSPGTERDNYEKDYNEWPVEDGAPWVDMDGDGIFSPGIDQPEFVGDEVLWYLSNDLDSSRSLRTYGSDPIIDPNTGLVTKFITPGNPVFGEGWYEGAGWPGGEDPDDRRFLMSIGPFSLGGIYVRQIEKNHDNPYLDWDLKNNNGEHVASGVYIAHLEMPNIGEKAMKLAVILENQR